MIYYISLFSKIRCTLTYLTTQKSDVIYECSPKPFITKAWFIAAPNIPENISENQLSHYET